MATLWKCVAEPSGNPPGPVHAARTHQRKNQRACCVCDFICNEAVPFRPYCAGDATRTRNVSEYMRVLALCLVIIIITDEYCRIAAAGPPYNVNSQSRDN